MKKVEHMSMRERVRALMGPHLEDEQPGRAAQLIDVFILFCILASCTLVVVEHFDQANAQLFLHIELGFAVIFVAEYMLRWYAAPNRALYPFSFLAVVDFLAIAPTILLLSPDILLLRSLRGIRLLRVVRLLRLLRLLKFLRHGALIYRGFVGMQIWLNAVNYQYRLVQLGKLSVWAAVAWFVGANMLHVTEVRLVGDVGPYADYWESYWNIIIVLVSGIEDKEPISLLGRAEVTVLLVAGVFLMSMLTGEIVSILVRKAQRLGKIPLMPPRARFQFHIVILGNNQHLDAVIQQLNKALENHYYILVVCEDAEELEVTSSRAYRRVFALQGDPRRAEVLDRAGIQNALRVIVLATEEHGEETTNQNIDDHTLMVATGVSSRNSRVHVVAELVEPESYRYGSILRNVEYVFSRSYGARLMTQAVLRPGVTKVYDEFMSFSDLSAQIYVYPVPEELRGRSFKDAQLHYFDNDAPVVLIGLERNASDALSRRFELFTDLLEGQTTETLRMGADDKLVVLAQGPPAFAQKEKEALWMGRASKD